MSTALIVVLVLLGLVLLHETALGSTLREGFAVAASSSTAASDAALAGEAKGDERDLRYSESFVDLTGRGVGIDFCRAVYRKGDPESLHMACTLSTGRELRGRTSREGFRWSRDDYWRVGTKGRMDYCRILRDPETGDWFSSCATVGPTGFRTIEERDTDPPPAIQALLAAYRGTLVWWRWADDEEDYAGNVTYERIGNPEAPTLLRPVKTRGLQLNRWPAAAQAALEPAPPLRDMLRWGEPGSLELHEAVAPRQIRAIACWIFWDAVEKGATILEASNSSKGIPKKDMLRLFVEGGGPDLPPALTTDAERAEEVSPSHRLAIGQVTTPGAMRPPTANPLVRPMALEKSGAYVFEIWDEQQRLMRLESGAGSVKAGQWQHVVVTTTDSTSWWPTWRFYLDGALVAEKRDGRSSAAASLTQNYIGRGLRGCLQDFRVRSEPMTEDDIKVAMKWSGARLHPTP
jgi:hypothetical protein